MDIVLKMKKEVYDLVMAALVELPLKAVPSQIRNQVCLDFQNQVAVQQRPAPSPKPQPDEEKPQLKRRELKKK